MDAALSQFRAETHDQLVNRVRAANWVALVATVAFTVLDLSANPSVAHQMIWYKVATAIGPAVLLGLLHTDWGRRWVSTLAIVSVAAIMAASVAQSPFFADQIMPEMGIGVAFITATLIPWRVGYQVLCVAAVSLAIAWDAAQGFATFHELYGSAVFSSVSIFVTYMYEKHRFALWRSDRELVSARDRAEANEEKFRDLVENLSDVVYAIEEDGNISYLSPTVEALSGYTPDEVLGRSQFDFVHPEDLPVMAENLVEGFAGNVKPLDLRFIVKSGEVRWARVNPRLVRNEDGRARLHGTLTDITDRKQAEEEKTALLEVAEEITGTLELREILDRVHRRVVKLLPCDSAFTFYWDPERRALPLAGQYGAPDEVVAELSAWEFRPGDPIAVELAMGRTVVINDIYDQPWLPAARLERGTAGAMVGVPLIVRERVYGACFAAHFTSSGRKFDAAQVKRFEGVVRLFSLACESADHHKQAQRLLEEARAANRHKSAFLANMSHELRTPLNAIIGFSEVLGDKIFGGLNDKQAEYITDIHGSGQHLLSLINDILDLSKIEAGRLELSPAEFDLPETCDNALVLMKERANRGGVTLHKELEEDIGVITADERKVKQVLINLLTNAVKFTGEGGSVTLRGRYSGDEVVISVIDTGIGIEKEDRELVFQEFRQVDSEHTRKHEGTGLGLALSKRLVELHGGRIWVESEPGQGSTFTFTLPKQTAADGGNRRADGR
jgi:PAS domain S-box-containing protein